MNFAFLLFCLLAGCDSALVTQSDPPEDPQPEAPQTGSQSVTLTPTEVTLQTAGDTVSLAATAVTASGETESAPKLTWKSMNPDVVTVSTAGLVTAAGSGTTLVIVTYERVSDTASIHVEWDNVLANVTIEGDVVVPNGEAWLIGPNVEIAGNLRTQEGTIGMRPGSSLRFLGANPDEYVGGGMTYVPDFARDIGLWIGGRGVLDIQGTPKQGWNRTGKHETWEPEDEYWITPTDIGDYEPRRWYPGDPIPRVPIPVDPGLLTWVPQDWLDNGIPAEVMNVTRDIVIEGPGHIHIHSQLPQRIEYVRLERLGVSNVATGDIVLGRYALHFHINGDGSRGTVIRGVAAVNSEGRVFVPHASHGITMIDNVSVNSFAHGFWWDSGDETDDLLVDQLCVSGVYMPEDMSLNTSRFDAVALETGHNMVMQNSVASGARGSLQSHGFSWVVGHDQSALWEFQFGNVAHNNAGAGVRFWTNSGADHHIANTISYRNGLAGIENGAYKNAVRYTDMLLFENQKHGLHHDANARLRDDGGVPSYERVIFHATDGPAVHTQGRQLAAGEYREFIDCVLEPGAGHPKVMVDRGDHPWLARFTRCNVVPDDFEFDLANTEGTHIIIENADGSGWEILIEDGQKIVTAR